MTEDRRQILQMLAEGKITADEAERLLNALDRPSQSVVAGGFNPPAKARYLRVLVDSRDNSKKVNIRIPVQLLRAGVRLASLIPVEARSEVNAAMREQGVQFDINQLKPENLDELIEHVNELTVDVDDGRQTVRVFAE
ncbi:MAG TPA: hypothetical protein VFN88_05915 [Caulobacteraceae bacterium]|nr:hypothetical protein [Caulobacteraceae bacterium]